MPLPENSAAANLQLLQKYLTQHTNQQDLQYQWKNTGHNHQLAICFTFPEGFTIDLKQVKQDSSYGERVMRLCESVNQPDTIKADLWTRTPNNGTLPGVRPGVPVDGEPIPPEEFLVPLDYTLLSFVFPGPKFGGGQFKGLVEAMKSWNPVSPDAFLGVPIIKDSLVPKGKAFLVNPEKMGDIIDGGVVGAFKAQKVVKAVKKPKPKKPTLKDFTKEQSDLAHEYWDEEEGQEE